MVWCLFLKILEKNTTFLKLKKQEEKKHCPSRGTPRVLSPRGTHLLEDALLNLLRVETAHSLRGGGEGGGEAVLVPPKRFFRSAEKKLLMTRGGANGAGESSRKETNAERRRGEKQKQKKRGRGFRAGGVGGTKR